MIANENILVVGATGQLGGAITKKMAQLGMPVTAMVRSEAAQKRFESAGMRSVVADLTNEGSLGKACDSAGIIIASATATVPTRSGDSVRAVDGLGYQNLIRAATEAGVRRFVFVSVPFLAGPNLPDLVRCKRETETALTASGMEVVVLRADAFMDVQFAMMGSAIPLLGTDTPTVLRPFAFVQKRFESIRDSIEKKSIAHIAGDPHTRHAFVALDDVADICIAAASSAVTGTFEVTGPEALSGLDVVELYQRLLHKKISVRRTPWFAIRLAARVLRAVHPAGSQMMQLALSMSEETFPNLAASQVFGVRVRSAETFLREKLAILNSSESAKSAGITSSSSQH